MSGSPSRPGAGAPEARSSTPSRYDPGALDTGSSRELDALRSEVARLSAELERADAELRALRDATPPRLSRLRRGIRLLAEEGPGAVVRRLGEGPAPRVTAILPAAPAPAPDEGLGDQYREWLRRATPDFIELELMRAASAAWSHRPLISVLMRVDATRADLLAEAIASVTLQTYTSWELCIVDSSGDAAVGGVVADAAADDPRVRAARCAADRGVAAALNVALGLATGELVTFLDPDAALRRHALHRVVELLQANPLAGLVYTDEDRLLPSNELGAPSFKPNWSPDLLLSTDYLGHLTVMRRDLVCEVGGMRDLGGDGEAHDLLLRVTELAEERGQAVTHVADMLYIARRPPAGGARRAVEEALSRRGREATVAPGPAPGWFQVRHALRDRPSVAIVIPTRDRVDLLRPCIESIDSRSTYREWTLLVVDNDSRDPETLRYLESLPHRVIRDPRPFNYSAIMNAAIAQVDAEHVVLLNNDVSVITPDWLEAMLEHSQRPEVGAVGCRLLYPDGRPQHEGVGVGIGSPAINLDLTALAPMGLAVREVSAVTAACMMIRRAVYREMDGLDESLRVAFNDVDLCLRLRRAGYRVVYTPLAELHHRESASRGDRRHDDDDIRFAELWGHHREVRDGYVNPHLEWLSPVRLRIP